MRTTAYLVTVLTSLVAASPVSALEGVGPGADAYLAPTASGSNPPPELCAGRTFAAFEVGDQAVTLSAFGRRARARALGNAEDLHHARAMGKVFDGAPQPALLTVEVSLKF